VPAFQVKLGANDLNSVDLPLNPTHSLTHSFIIDTKAVSSLPLSVHTPHLVKPTTTGVILYNRDGKPVTYYWI